MDKQSEHGTDAAPIKPVSSLRSHFEGLKANQASQDESTTTSKPSPFTLRPVESPAATPQFRQSFDLPRPISPWTSSENRGLDSPRTPGPQKRRPESPPKSNNRRPVSMLAQPSPQLTPAVNVESPRSPPRTYFDRSASRSPDRVDNSPFAKVRDLISQHSSASSTRPPTPRAGSIDTTERQKHETGSHKVAEPVITQAFSKAPPVNRADKPKIPAKIANLPVQNGTAGLLPDQRRPSFEARISPFNTPPSSDGSPSPAESPDTNTLAPDSVKPKLQSEAGNTTERVEGPTTVHNPAVRPVDPRFMGFAKPAVHQERKDPRTLGLAGPDPKPPAREPTIPSRANTVSERPPPRDPRDLGFSSAGRPPQRVVSENIRSTPPPQVVGQQSAAPQSLKDARPFGSGVPLVHTDVIAEEPSPGLPPRRIIRAPPPRPPEESKNPALRAARQPSPGVVPDRSTKPGVASVLPRAPIAPVDGRFPPPPKRNTDEMEKPTSFQHQITTVAKKALAGGYSQQPDASEYANDSDEAEGSLDAPNTLRNEYPDSTQTNRLPPFYKSGLREINVKSDSRVFDVCGQFLCTAGYVTRVFDMSAGEQIMGINHGETVKVTAVAFKPASNFEAEGQRIWTGNNAGEIHEVEIDTHSTVSTSSSHNRREIVQILRHRKDLWTLDDDGKLFVWPADESGVPNLRFRHISHRVQKGHTFSLVVGDKLWLATGKEVRIYIPGNEASFAALTKPLVQSGTGEITSGTSSDEHGGRVYFGHTDGKVTIYSTKDYTCVGNVKASDYKINALSFVGDRLWAAYKTGKIYVYDTTPTPWKVKKDWRAHDGPAIGFLQDSSSLWALGRLQVVTVGHDNYLRLWDGMLEDDWIETAMHEADVQYCRFREIRAAVVTWNVGASTPYDLRNDFIADAIHAEDPPEILAFGFQEVVDLEDRAVTAKSIFGFGKKKDPVNTEQHQSRVYREWRDYLSKVISRYTSATYSYSELHTSSLVGLFQCIFIRREDRSNVRDLFGISVKCGLKGHYGNKGALVTRFILDDSTLCFVNCHLAAGQSNTSHRNNDVANILESESLPAERDPDTRMSLYIGGGDGTQILDHEICILNGDLNYRIDTVPRDTVISMIKRNDLSKLLDRDQLLVSRRRVSGFRLAAFTELPITFAPTYKYDPGTDIYDSSEKKRSPAWCDRVLYRGTSRVKQLEYRRHEVKVSDHRPVSALFKIRVKTIDSKKRAKVKEECYERFAEVKRAMAEKARVSHFMNSLGVTEREARGLLRAP